MKLLSLNFLCLFLLAGAILPLKTAYADEDVVEGEDANNPVEEEEEEGVVEDEDDSNDVLANDNVEEEVEEEEEVTSHKDVNTAILFQSGFEPVVTAGKKAKGYIHFSNGGSNSFVVTNIDGSFRYPQDYSYTIQNFSSIHPNKVVDAGKESSFSYLFTPGELAGGKSFGLSIIVNYKDLEGNFYQDAVFNQTIQVEENDDDVDTETFFMYLMLTGLGALAILGLYHVTSSKTKRTKRSQSSSNVTNGGLEIGTTGGPVDYGWIPQETLKVLQKTPSPRLSRRKGKKGVETSGESE